METYQNPGNKSLNAKLDDAYKLISEATILQMAKHDASVSNVVSGLDRQCFGIIAEQEKFSPNYILFYINGESALKGDALQLCLNDKDNFDITFAFCNYLVIQYTHLDLLDIFNNYNRQLRSYVEFFGYLTVTDNLLAKFEGYDYSIITKDKGVVYIPHIEKLKFYREFFGNVHNQPKPIDENVVYILLNTASSHFKIGHSKKVSHREKTLQAQEPEVETIAFWKAPKEVETHLHKTFASKRTRGEWFKLNFSEMEIIKQLMSKFN